MKPLIPAAPDHETLQRRAEDVRARVAFYASTPAYRRAFEIEGYGDLAAELTTLSKAQRWEEMPPHISDEMLRTYATVGTYDEIAGKLQERYGDVVSSVEFSIPATGPAEREQLTAMVAALQSGTA